MTKSMIPLTMPIRDHCNKDEIQKQELSCDDIIKSGSVAQRQSAAFTLQKSEVQILSDPPNIGEKLFGLPTIFLSNLFYHYSSGFIIQAKESF